FPVSWSPVNFERVFEDFGLVMEVVVPQDRISKSPRGFAFDRMSTEEEVENVALDLNEESFGGIKLKVQKAKYGPERKNRV
ncbi:hypothetical protein PJP07_30605, partial [Mycobacterium kansasii]